MAEPDVHEPNFSRNGNLPVREMPKSIRPQYSMPPRPQLDGRIRRADEAFEEGRRLYNQGEFASARVEFDKVIDLLLASSEAAPDRYRMEKKLEELIDKIHRFDLEGLGAGNLEAQVAYDKAPIEEILEMTFPIDPSLKAKVMDQVAATSSQLPLETNDEVLRWINYFTSERGKRTLIGGLRRAGKYKDMIRRILNEEGVPQELIFLAQAESGFLPRARSNKAAVGMWQFVKFRGQEYGLMQTKYADDRLDPEKATRAGAKHLHDLYKQLGDWYLALAAYNCGPYCVTRAVQRTGYADYWELMRLNALPRETSNYVPIILAMTIVSKNLAAYGIEVTNVEEALEYDTLALESDTSIALLADIVESGLAELREMNPSLLKDVAPAGYHVRVPKGTIEGLVAAMAMIPAEKRLTYRAHRVQDGETAASIASRFKIAQSSLIAIHRAPADGIDAGDMVLFPVRAAAPARVVKRPVVAAKKPAAAKPQASTPRKSSGQPVASRTTPKTASAR